MSNPIKPSFRTEWFPIALILLSFVSGIYFYQYLPAIVPSHWNFQGEIDGYSSTGVAAFLLPGMMLGMYLLFVFLPYIDPKKEQYAGFASSYHIFKSLMIAFMYVLYMMMGLNGLGYVINIGVWVPIMVGALLAVIGLIMGRIKSNWFMGIRTPWTISSEYVWNKTHKLSVKFFILSGILMAATVLFAPTIKLILLIASLSVAVLGAPISSYFFYIQEKKALDKK